MYPAIALTTVSLTALLLAEWRGVKGVEVVAKPLASLGFLLAAYNQGALGSGYGRAIFAGLCLSMVGDVLLMSQAQGMFLGGLGAFLLGHVAYATAFVVRGVGLSVSLAAAALLAIPASLVGRWLWPHTPSEMRGPVLGYIVVISAMVALSLGTFSKLGGAAVLLGAVMFYLSDLSVARDRFVKREFLNRLWGLPMYYAAQLVLASTVR